MANEVEKVNVFGGQVAAVDTKSLAQKAAASAQNSPRAGAPGGADYLNFSGKRGVYTIGQEKRRVDEDELWVVNVTSFEDGFVCWKASKPVGTRMANIFTGVPIQQPQDDEGGPFDYDRGEGWHQAKGMVLKSLDDDDGQQGYFKINSVSGVAEMADLMDAFARRAAEGEPAWPIIRLSMEEFEAQGFKNFKPKFIFEGWLTDDQMTQLAQDPDMDVSEWLDSAPSEEKKPAPKAEPKGKATRRRRT